MGAVLNLRILVILGLQGFGVLGLWGVRLMALRL